MKCVAEMLEVIVDTNVFIDAIFSKDEAILPIFEKECNGELRFVFCNQTIGELHGIIEEICMRLKYNKKNIHKIYRSIGYILARGRNLGALKNINRYCEDDEDDKFIECAKIGQVKYIISSDIHINQIPSAIKDFYKLNIVTIDPLEFLANYNNISVFSYLKTLSGKTLSNGIRVNSKR